MRVRGLTAVLHSLNFLESGKHDVQYGVIADEDDVGTVVACADMQKYMKLAYRVGERETSMGKPINIMAKLMPADVYLVINDDVLCLEPNWDDKIAQAVEETPHGVFFWDNAFEQEVLFPIFTDKWHQAAGRLYTEHYPFWYDDLVLCELWTMVTDTIPIELPIKIADRPRTTTHRMRDLKFWQAFYTGTRVLRLEESYEIAEKLGLPKPKYGALMADRLTQHLTTVPDEKLAQIEQEQGDRNPPDEAYLVARAKAQAILDSIAERKAA